MGTPPVDRHSPQLPNPNGKRVSPVTTADSRKKPRKDNEDEAAGSTQEKEEKVKPTRGSRSVNTSFILYLTADDYFFWISGPVRSVAVSKWNASALSRGLRASVAWQGIMSVFLKSQIAESGLPSLFPMFFVFYSGSLTAVLLGNTNF
jgi:hypothetical protein